MRTILALGVLVGCGPGGEREYSLGMRQLAAPDYEPAEWAPADSSNYNDRSRTPDEVDYIVVHTVQGSAEAAIAWFQDPMSNVSAHFVVSSAGEVTQTLEVENLGWHDACFNAGSIGIEHEGWVEEPEIWYTPQMYQASAELVRTLATRWTIPLDRQHILGHDEADDCSTHTDPGPGWDWEYYMELILAPGEYSAGLTLVDAPVRLTAGDEAIVTFELENDGNTTWPGLTELATSQPRDRQSVFSPGGGWLEATRPTRVMGALLPGDRVQLSFRILAPEITMATAYVEHFELVTPQQKWFGPPHLALEVLVDPRVERTNEDAHRRTIHGGCSIAGLGARP